MFFFTVPICYELETTRKWAEVKDTEMDEEEEEEEPGTLIPGTTEKIRGLHRSVPGITVGRVARYIDANCNAKYLKTGDPVLTDAQLLWCLQRCGLLKSNHEMVKWSTDVPPKIFVEEGYLQQV